MMKRFTSFLALMLMFVSGMVAQDLEHSTISIGQPQEDFQTDTWYLLYQRRGGDGYAHYENATTRFYKRAVTFGQDPLTDGMKASTASKWLLKFESTETEGIYKIVFANGAYWQAAGTTNSSAINPVETKYDATDWAVYRVMVDDAETGEKVGGVDGAGKPVFALNIGSKAGARLDNNGNGGTLAIWDSGELTDVESNAAWSIVSVDFGMLDERDAAMIELQNVYASYSEYEFTAGTEPGNYGEAEVAAFQAAMDAASVADGPSGASLTAEDLQKMAEDIKAAYEAVLASRVPFAMDIKPGYYYITSALDFVTSTTTEATEDPETGEEIPGETIEVHHTKAMYTDGNNARWAELDDAARQNANYLWKVEAAGNKTYKLINTQTEAQFTKVATSAQITLSEGSDSLMVFDTAGKEGVYNIRLAAQAERDYFYLHCGGHGGGAGVQGNLVGWCSTYTAETDFCGATEWKLEEVDEATALAIIEACSPQKQIKLMTDSAAVILAAAPSMIKIANDVKTEIDEANPIVKDATQLHSPMTTDDTQCGGDAEAVYPFLLDGNTSTYWHSAWEGGNQPNGTHYIQISDVDAESVAFVFTRRPVQNDHATEISAYGYDEANDDLEKGAGELLATMAFPFGSNTETLTSDVFKTNGHSVIRLYAEATTNNRGYWHMSEFQMYPATSGTVYATTQANVRASEIAALEAAIAAWKAIDLAAIAQPAEIQAQFDALAQAYEAFKAVYVDPAALRAAIANAPDTKVIKIGNNPGEWASAEGSVASLVAAAQAYDEAGKYTPAESEKFISDLSAAGENMFASANKIKTGKWYNISFATEALYDEAGFDKTGAQHGYVEAANAETSPELFGKVVTAAKYVSEQGSYTNDEGNEVKFTIYETEKLNVNEDATLNAGIHFMDKADVDADMAKWQFVAVGDSAYAIQNKATGLYMRTSGGSGRVYLSVQPSLFNVSAIGYGQNLISAKNIAGANQNNLHAQRDINMLVTWSSADAGSNSGLMIQEVEDVTEAPANDFTMSIWPGRVYTMCYPASLTAKEGTFYTASIEGTTVTLNPLKDNSVKAGEAAIFINGDTKDYEEVVDDEDSEDYNADAYELVGFTHGTEFVAEADTTGILRGSFVNMNIGRGNLWASGNNLVVTKKSSNTLGANTAYIAAGLGIDQLESEITLVIDGKEVDGINAAIANVSKNGNIYTIDGKLVGRGNLNSLKNMGKGIYVINGVKVTVK